MHGELIVVDDVAGAFAELVIDAFQRREDEDFCLALSGGPGAEACYGRLAEWGAERIDWWQVSVFWAEERCVPADHPDSNQRLVRQALLERVGAANAVYPMRCAEGPGPYQLRLGEIGGLDLVHLTLGPDGDTAGLFAGSTALAADPGQWVTMSQDPAGRAPHERMTLTLSGLERARLVVITATGPECADAMQAIADGAARPAAQVAAGRVAWLVDRAVEPVRR